jgi:hypothetical protein
MVGLAHFSSLSYRKKGRPSGPQPRICAKSWNESSHRGTKRCRSLVVDGKGCSSDGHPFSSVEMEILDVIEVDIWLIAHIFVSLSDVGLL